MKGRKKHSTKRTGSVRIIGGEWRGRRLPVPDLDGLRPSGDRSRETLFNWLQPYLHKARCVDLFAGTGVLGIEAVSRGAEHAILVEKSPLAAATIKKSIDLLNTDQISLVNTDAMSWLADQPVKSIDILMIDPPFSYDTQNLILQQLDDGQYVRPGGMVYIESSVSESPPAFSSEWKILKQKELGDVRMQLIEKK